MTQATTTTDVTVVTINQVPDISIYCWVFRKDSRIVVAAVIKSNIVRWVDQSCESPDEYMDQLVTDVMGDVATRVVGAGNTGMVGTDLPDVSTADFCVGCDLFLSQNRVLVSSNRRGKPLVAYDKSKSTEFPIAGLVAKWSGIAAANSEMILFPDNRADIDRNGIVDQADYDQWYAAVGKPNPSVTGQIVEPPDPAPAATAPAPTEAPVNG